MNDRPTLGETDQSLPYSYPIHPAELSTGRGTKFELQPDAAACENIARDLGILGLRKVRFSCEFSALDKHDWQMRAQFGATVTQACVVTLEPVTTRIDTTIERQWLHQMAQPDDGEEIEMFEDERADPLGDVIDLGQVLCETLAIALPLYPRCENAALDAQIYTAPGIAPMTDADARPFAGLSELRDKLSKGHDDA